MEEDIQKEFKNQTLDNSSPQENPYQKDESKELKSRLKEQEARIKELENYKQEVENQKERQTLFKEYLFSNEDKDVATNLISKYRMKDQASFIKDFYSQVIKPRDSLSRADQLYASYNSKSTASPDVLADFGKMFVKSK